MLSKTCPQCKIEKQSFHFSISATFKDGLRSWCKGCSKNAWIKYSRTREGIATRMYCGQRSRSKAKIMPPPSYSKKAFFKWLISRPNFETLFEQWTDSGWAKDMKPSADRIDDYKPYTLKNIRLTTFKKNRLRASEDMKNGLNNKVSKAVTQHSKDGNLIGSYWSQMAAYRSTGIDPTAIGRCCMTKHRQKTAGGFIWKFKEKNED